MKNYLLLKDILNSYREEEPDFSDFLCCFVEEYVGVEDNFIAFFLQLSQSFLDEHRVQTDVHGAFISKFAIAYLGDEYYNHSSRKIYNSIFREYFVEWLEDQIEKELQWTQNGNLYWIQEKGGVV